MDIQIFRVDAQAAAEFDRLRQIKTLKRIGRADLLIGCITCARRWPTGPMSARSTFRGVQFSLRFRSLLRIFRLCEHLQGFFITTHRFP